MFVGEQPGDVEDREGRPFVGPAGRLLRELLEEVGIPDEDVYVTNAVKHFKWRPKGKRRLHDKPSWAEIAACNVWLAGELEAVRPALVVCLGATAAQALLGRSARVGALRGTLAELDDGTPATVTIHPSAVLRAGEERELRRAELAEDLAFARDSAAPCDASDLEDREVLTRDVHGDVVHGHLPDGAARGPVVRVAVHDEVGAMRADRAGQAPGAEERPDGLRLADERVLNRRVVEEHDPLVAARDLLEAAFERVDLERRLLVHVA